MGKIKPFDYTYIEKKKKPEPEKPVAPVVQFVKMEEVITELRKALGEPIPREEIITLIKGLAPTKEFLESLIIPNIPKPVKGDDGDNYILTPKDKKEIASSIKVPVVEKVIEIVPSKITPVEVRDMLESFKKGKKLSINAIEELATIIEDIYKRLNEKTTDSKEKGVDVKRSIYGGNTQSVRFIDDETPSGTIDGNNTVFTTQYVPARNSLKVYLGGSRMRITEDYTLSGKEITFLIAPQVGEKLLVDYRQ